MKKLMFVLVILGLVLTASSALAVNPLQFDITLDSTGQDVEFISTQAVNPAYKSYDFVCDINQFDLDVAVVGLQDYVDAEKRVFDIASYDFGLPMTGVNNTYDSNGLTCDFDVWVDDDGYVHAALSNIVLAQNGGLDVLGVTVAGSITVKGLTELWDDDFNGYGVDAILDDTADWTNENRKFFVGSNYNGQAAYESSYWAEFPGIALVDTIDSLYDQQNFRVKTEAFKFQIADPLVKCQWYLLARYSDYGHIRVKAALDGNSGTDLLYVRLLDTDGYDSLDYYVAEYNPASPIGLELDFEGDNVFARVTHAGQTTTISYTTTITYPGKVGIGAENQWGYCFGYFDNFAVYANDVIVPAQCGDQGTVYLDADLNRDCRVNLADFALFAKSWLDDGGSF
jgi:hypothetical protein